MAWCCDFTICTKCQLTVCPVYSYAGCWLLVTQYSSGNSKSSWILWETENTSNMCAQPQRFNLYKSIHWNDTERQLTTFCYTKCAKLEHRNCFIRDTLNQYLLNFLVDFRLWWNNWVLLLMNWSLTHWFPFISVYLKLRFEFLLIFGDKCLYSCFYFKIEWRVCLHVCRVCQCVEFSEFSLWFLVYSII